MKKNKISEAAIRETIVAPARGSRETRWILLLSLMIVAICSFVIATRGKDSAAEQLESWQLNAFTELSSNEIGVFNALLTAAIEIEDSHDLEDGYWLEIKELEEMYIPPFVKDAAWQKQGKIQWDKKNYNSQDRHLAVYKGEPTTPDIAGTFLLLMLHDHKKKQGNASPGPVHAPFEIWYHPARDRNFPEIITDQAFIAAGWQEIVALTGEDEVSKMKGELL